MKEDIYAREDYIRPSVAVSSKSDGLSSCFRPLDEVLDADDGPSDKRVGGVIGHGLTPILKRQRRNMPHRLSIRLNNTTMRPLVLRKHLLELGEQRAVGEVKVAYSLGQIVGSVIGRRSVCDGDLVRFGGDVFGECGVEMKIGPDEFDEEVDEVEAVEEAGLAWFGEYQDGEEGLQGRVGGTDGFEFLQEVVLGEGGRGTIGRECTGGCIGGR